MKAVRYCVSKAGKKGGCYMTRSLVGTDSVMKSGKIISRPAIPLRQQVYRSTKKTNLL